MVFFNLIYQGYTQDHQRILKIGLGAYLGILAILYSDKLPENLVEYKAVEFFKSWGWLLILIDYLVLNLLHYLQTGQYLFRQVPPQLRRRYVSWKEPGPEDYHLIDNNDYQEYDTEDEADMMNHPDESNVMNPGDQSDRMNPSDKSNVNPSDQSNRMNPSDQSNRMNSIDSVPPAGPPVHPKDYVNVENGSQVAPPPYSTQVSSPVSPPFDPNYTIDDDQNVSLGDDQDYFEDNQEPQIIDNYAMNQSGLQADESESISD